MIDAVKAGALVLSILPLALDSVMEFVIKKIKRNTIRTTKPININRVSCPFLFLVVSKSFRDLLTPENFNFLVNILTKNIFK